MINNSASICQAEGYDLCSLKLKSRDTGECETLTLTTQAVFLPLLPKLYVKIKMYPL